ncbi:MAG: hypothetical protein IJE04_00525 [Bacilli bacterium]|nr:hypothetical protein [Bacilli bacterium]
MDQNNNFNTQGYNNFTNNQSNTNMNNNFNQPPVNNQAPRKKPNIGLIAGIVGAVLVVGIGGILLFNKPSNEPNNNMQNNGGTNNSSNVVYNDSSRSINSTYTFDEATSKFAFKEYETTLIFQQNNNIKLSSIKLGNISNVSFYYENASAYYTFNFEESGSSSINEFVENFNNGILGGGKRQTTFQNIKMLESNEEYAFISCQESGNSSYKYYFAKQIGGKVFYAYSDRHLNELDDNKKTEMLIGFKELFNALSTDDNKEPYISDKIINVPVVLNKQIKDYKFIDTIQLVHPKTSTANYRNYMKGSVNLYSADNKSLVVQYDADKFYNKVEWNKNLSSKIKYSDEDNFFGIKDGNNTQMFSISKSENIETENNFNEYLNKFFN